jgi:hypothetical protein
MTRRNHKQLPPRLVPLRYDHVYCELCRRTIAAGEPVSWWKVTDFRGRDARKSQRFCTRRAAYCTDCHRANITAGMPLRPLVSFLQR